MLDKGSKLDRLSERAEGWRLGTRAKCRQVGLAAGRKESMVTVMPRGK